MMNINITITATSDKCSITANGVTRTFIRTGRGSCKGEQNGDWEDDEEKLGTELCELMEDHFAFMPLGLMQACE